MSTPIIGIAFGNTSSSIAYINLKNDVEVIPNPDGERVIPSALSYVNDDEYHGGQALQQLIRNPQNTCVNFRDFIGLTFDQCNVSRLSLGAPLVDLGDGVPGFIVKRGNGKEEKLSISEVISRHLKNLKRAAEDYIGTSISSAVISIPTNFTQTQKEALKQSASNIGLNIVQYINEPSAALLSHIEAFSIDKDANVVVADFGGVRSDAAVISVRNGIFTLLATKHDNELGGSNLDSELVEFFAKDFEKKHKLNPRNDSRAMTKLRLSSQLTKKTLSNVTTATISIDSLSNGIDYHSSINRMRYELVGSKVFSNFSGFIHSVIKKADLDPLDIDFVLLVGGVSFTPKLLSVMKLIFPDTVEILDPQNKNCGNNPDELIASGAAIQGQLLSSYDADELNQALQPIVINIPHLSKPIGVRDSNGNFVPILLAYSSYPLKKSLLLKDARGDFLIDVYEGDHHIKETILEAEHGSNSEKENIESDWSSDEDEPEVVREKHYTLGTKLMELAVKNTEGLELIFSVDKDSVLKVVARDLKTNKIVKSQL